MSLSSDGNQGYLDIRNAILRVGTLDVYGITGVDQVTNVVKQNSVLIWDDQGSDMTTPPFQKGAGVARSTSPPEINLVDSEGNNFMYQGLKLPNSWQGEFDLYFADATAGAINCHFYTTSTTSYADDGYELAFDRENSTITLRYDAAQVAQATGVTLSTQWHTASVTFNRGAWAVSLDGERLLTHDDDERSAVYDNTTGQYVRFETAATTDRKVRYIKFLNNGAPWLESNAGHLYNLSSNVAIGVSEDDYRFSVAGTANLGATTVTSIAVGDDTDATSTSTGALTVQGLGVASNLHATNVYATNVFVGTHAGVDAYDFSVHGTANTGVLTATSIVVGDETEATSVSTGALQTFALGVESNIHTNNLYSDHANTQTLEVNETVTVNANVYAKGLHLAQVASNLVTWDSTTGDLMDSGGLISNKLAIVSEQPPVALTGDSTVIDGHGRYKVTSSSEGNEPNFGDWNCFNKATGGTNAWHTDLNYDLSTGVHNDSTVLLGGVQGEWVKLELPYKTVLRHIIVNARDSATAIRAPTDFTVLGSNDDSNWTSLLSIDDESYTADEDHTFAVNATASYKYYALVVEKIGVTSQPNCIVGEWKLFTETFSVDAGVVSTTAASGLDVGYTEHPVEAMTNPIHYAEGHGTYEADASSKNQWFTQTYGSPFDYVIGNNMWASVNSWSSSNVYNNANWTTDVGGTRHYGEWLQLKNPYAITLAYTDVYPRALSTNGTSRGPGAGVILGSNDGENWYKLTEFSGKTYTNGVATKIDVNATTPYTWYRIVTSKLADANASDTNLNIGEWRLFAEKPVTRMENVHISGDLSSETLQTGYIKWPRKSLKANESEGYVASASSTFNTLEQWQAWHAFNNYNTDRGLALSPNWQSAVSFNSSGEPLNGTAISFDGMDGEWIQIQMPNKIALSHFTIGRRNDNANSVNSGYMYGSNDGINWTRLVYFNGITYSLAPVNTAFRERVNVESKQSFNHYRLFITKINPAGGNYRAILEELQLFEAATGVGAAPTSAKLQVAGSLGMAKGSEFFAGDDVVMELPKHDRPLVKYPEVVMTTSQDVTTLTYEGYTVSASNDRGSSYRPWKAFDGLREDAGGWGTSNYYDSSTGEAKNTSTQFEGNYGEYLELQLPVMIKLEKVVIKPRDVDASKVPEDAPGSGYIYASNDGSDWTLLHSFSGLSYGGASSNGDATNETLQVNASHAYKYYRLQATSRSGQNGSDEYVNVAELEYWGYEEGDTSVDVVHRSIPNKPSPQHLEVYWDAADSNSYSFADSSNVYDLSGSGVTGAITGNNGFDAEYNAWVFDGSGDYISGTQGLGTGQPVHSQSVWFKMNANTGDYQYICMIGTNSTDDQSAITLNSDDEIRFEMYGTPTALTTDTKVVADAWYHVVAVYTGGNWNNTNCSLYVNGVKVVLNNGSNTTTSPTITGDLVRLGSTGSQWELNGSIANFRLFSKALNADQVRELYEYDAERFGHRQNLVSLHKGNLGVGVAHPTSRFEVAGADGIQEYPPRAMTDYETYIEGHGVFRASASSYRTTNQEAWQAFNKFITNSSPYIYRWRSVDNIYTSSLANTTTGSARLSEYTPYGTYLILELPYKICLKTYVWIGITTQIPREGQIWGSNDGMSWSLVDAFTDGGAGWVAAGSGTTDYNEYPDTREITGNTAYYSQYAFIITRNRGDDATSIRELRYFGTPAPSSLEDGHLTLGKALTLPRVSGHPAGAETPQAESLVVHYDTTVDSVVSGSTVVDISGNGINGTLTNGAAYSSTDRALVFDGVNDYVSGTLNNPSGAWVHSVSVWFKADTLANCIWHLGSDGGGGGSDTSSINLNSDGTILWFYWANDVKFNTAVRTGMWNHVVCVYNGGTAYTSRRLWLNGTEQTITQTYGSQLNQALDIGANTSLRLMGRITNTTVVDGSISNFKIWGGVALTAEEVAMEYALGRTGKSLNLTDTALCLGGTVPRAQLDVRGSARFEGTAYVSRDLTVGGGNVQAENYLHVTDGFIYGGTDGSRFRISAPCDNLIMSSGNDIVLSNDVSDQCASATYDTRINKGIIVKGSRNSTYEGRVGIGTGLPAGQLQVYDNTNTKSLLSVRSGSSTAARTEINSGIRFDNHSVEYFGAGGAASANHSYHIRFNSNRMMTLYYDGDDLEFSWGGGGNYEVRASIGISAEFGFTFTGQHRNFIKDISYKEVVEKELGGLIVCANNNEYVKISDGIAKGSNAITQNEALPIVSLSAKAYDKSCFGVISESEDPESKRSGSLGMFKSYYDTEDGDKRVIINSLGEGAMWVTDINGPLESGDYITTSNVAGYGQKQDIEFLANYTVAKITMDCDFDPPDIPVQRIVKELSNVTYWYQLEDATSNAHDRTVEETYYTIDRHVEVYGHVDEQSNVFVPPEHDVELYVKTQVNTVSEEVWAALPEDERVLYDANTFTYTQTIEIAPEVWDDLGVEEQNTYAHGYFNVVTDEVAVDTPGAVERTRTLYKKVVNDTKVEPETPEDYLSEVRDEWVNVLDEHGQLQWEDVPWGDTEPAYKLRYLDAEGQITTRHNAVHIAAFVGVTYHCG
jgi:hypothetical protein